MLGPTYPILYVYFYISIMFGKWRLSSHILSLYKVRWTYSTVLSMHKKVILKTVQFLTLYRFCFIKCYLKSNFFLKSLPAFTLFCIGYNFVYLYIIRLWLTVNSAQHSNKWTDRTVSQFSLCRVGLFFYHLPLSLSSLSLWLCFMLSLCAFTIWLHLMFSATCHHCHVPWLYWNLHGEKVFGMMVWPL